MIFLNIIILLSILYLYFCLILIAINKFKGGKNPFIFVDEIGQIIAENRRQNMIKHEKERVQDDRERMS